MSAVAQRWADERVPDSAWRATPGDTFAHRALEQDQAAGGHDQRLLTRADGAVVLASLLLRARGRRCYAYLRYAGGTNKTLEMYVGEVAEATRTANLSAGWVIAHRRGLLSPAA